MLPEGKRRTRRLGTIDIILNGYSSRTVSFDPEVARECDRLHRFAISSGKMPEIEDLMMASSRVCHDAISETRNVEDFDCSGVPIVNPFEEGALYLNSSTTSSRS